MAPKKTHGLSHSKEYRCWRAFKNRCTNIKNVQYSDYGGRGIDICERWLTFENFYEDMGACPDGYQIDRIDNNKGYSKENCRWTTGKINSRNRRSATIHKIDKESIVQQELIDKIGWSKTQFRWYRRKHGISWILDNFKDGTLPDRVNQSLEKDDLLGKTFGSWTVLQFICYKKSDGNRYLCKCNCGIEKDVIGYHLRVGKSTQCRKCAYENQTNKPN